MSIEPGHTDRPLEPGGPVRDLAPRRRHLFLAMVLSFVVLQIIGFALVAGACLTSSCTFTGGASSIGYAAAWFIACFVVVALVGWRTLRGPASPTDGRSTAAAHQLADGQPAWPPDPARRLASFLDRLDRLPTDDVRLLAVRPLDPAGHEAARARALDAARFGGRTTMVEDATTRIAGWIGQAFGTRSFDPEYVALAWRHEPLRLEDRDRLLATLSDAALAVLVEDSIDEPTYGELVGPCGHLAGEPPDREVGDPTPR